MTINSTRISGYANPTHLSQEDRAVAILQTRNGGMLVLGIWLVLHGVLALVSVAIPPIVMPVLALVAGVLILAGK
jgi:hypothetical protein